MPTPERRSLSLKGSISGGDSSSNSGVLANAGGGATSFGGRLGSIPDGGQASPLPGSSGTLTPPPQAGHRGNTADDLTSANGGSAPSRPRSPSPPPRHAAGQSLPVGSQSPTAPATAAAGDEASFGRSLRERDDEIVRLREQVRIVSKGPKFSSSAEDDASSRKLFEENARLRRDVSQLQDALKVRPGAGAGSLAVPKSEESTARALGASANTVSGAARGAGLTPPRRGSQDRGSDLEASVVAATAGGHAPTGSPVRSSPRSAMLPSRVLQLQRQLKEQDDDRRCLEGTLVDARAAIARLEARNQQLQATSPDDEGGLSDNDAGCADVDLGGSGKTIGAHGSGGHRSTSQNPKHRINELYSMLAAAQKDRQRSQEEARQRLDQLRYEREQWRQEREALLQDQRRREKTEDMLRRQGAAVQERLDRLQFGETSQEQERRQARAQAQQPGLNKFPKRLVAAQVLVGGGRGEGTGEGLNVHEADNQEQLTDQLEAQIRSQSLELARLRREVEQLEGERADACARLLAGKQIGLSVSAPLAAEVPQELTLIAQQPRGRGRGGQIASTGSLHGRGARRLNTTASTGALGSRGAAVGNAACRGVSAGTLASTGGLRDVAARGHIVPTVPSLSLHLGFNGGRTGTALGSRYGATASSCGDGPSTFGASSCTSSEDDDESSTGSSSAATETRKRAYSSLCAVFGDSPLPRIPDVGWYFRLRINSGCSNWVGGFAIGVTLSKPSSLVPLPDRAARVPRSWIAGYWGRTFANGQERLNDWNPQALRPGDEVAFLVGTEGECSVFVNDEERCRFADPPVPVSQHMIAVEEVELTALIDVSAAATSVTFLNGAPPPSSAMRRRPPQLSGQSVALATSQEALGAATENGQPFEVAVVAHAHARPAPSSATSCGGACGCAAPRGGLQHLVVPPRPGGSGASSVPPPVGPLSVTVASTAAAAVRRVPQLALPLLVS